LERKFDVVLAVEEEKGVGDGKLLYILSLRSSISSIPKSLWITAMTPEQNSGDCQEERSNTRTPQGEGEEGWNRYKKEKMGNKELTSILRVLNTFSTLPIVPIKSPLGNIRCAHI
jgi:hypothetical protein